MSQSAPPALPIPEIYSGLIRLHILHHAGEKPVYGLWIIEELARHGYKLSPGTLYPLLHALARRGFLRAQPRRAGGRLRRFYCITSAGRAARRSARPRVPELFGELFEAELKLVFGPHARQRQAPPRRAARRKKGND